jgi:hypothetical protein
VQLEGKAVHELCGHCQESICVHCKKQRGPYR